MLGQSVLCPICGSNQFGIVDENEITKRAQNYQVEHKELIEKRKQELGSLKKHLRDITTEQLFNAKTALTEAIRVAQKQVVTLTRLYNVSKAYYSVLGKLQTADGEAYTQELMLTENGIHDAIEKNDAVIPPADRTAAVELEVQRLLALVNYSMKKQLSGSALLEDVRPNATSVPVNINYDENLLSSKISSIRSYIQNFEYLDASRKLDDANKKNDIATHEIEELEKLSAKAKTCAEQIRVLLKEMNTEEYNQVGPYLYKIFRKLSRDVDVSGIQLKCGRGDDLLMLTDDQNKPILNMLSDGQLSVFMLSYFLGNIFRMESYEQFQVYFVDDITSCMDDVNMLAFLDFIKYQLSSEKSAIVQLFFSTCDGRIQDMLRYKMDNCGLEYVEIGIKEFDGQLLAL